MSSLSSKAWYEQHSILQLIAIAIFVVFGCLILNDRFNWFDDAYYIMLAKALANGYGYCDINLPNPQLHKLFPPGLSVLLTIPSLLHVSLKTKLIIFKLILIVCGALALYAFAYLARKEGYKETTITYTIIIAATSIALVGYSSRVASEMLYILLSVLVFISLNTYEQSPKLSRHLFISAILIVFCLLTRSIGVLLLPAITVSWIIRRDFIKLALLLSLVVLFISPWIALTKRTGAGGTSRYLNDMLVQYANTDTEAKGNLTKAFSNKILENSKLIASREIPRIIFSIAASSTVLDNYWLNLASLPIRLIITLLTLTPIILRLWPKPTVSTLYLIFYLGLLLIWPWEPSRFLIPLIPFLVLSFFVSLELLAEKLQARSLISPRLSNLILPICLGILLLSHLISDIRFTAIVWRSGDYSFEAAQFWQDTSLAYQWINENVSKDSLLGCMPALEAHAYLFTERKSVALQSSARLCAELKISHIILVDEKLVNGNKEGQSAEDFRYLLKQVGSDSFLKLIYQNDTVKIFSVDQNRLAELLKSPQ